MPAKKRLQVINLFTKSPRKTTSSRHTLWQKEQKNRKTRRSLRKIFLALFLFGFFSTIYFLNYYRAIFYNPYQPLPTNITFNSNPKEDYRVNILLISTDDNKSLLDLVLATYSHQEGTFRLLKIPTNVYLSLPSGYGWGNLKSAYLLGQTEEEQKGSDQLVRSVETLLATPVAGYISIRDPKYSFDLADLENNRQQLFGFNFWLKSTVSKLYLDKYVHSSLSPLSLAKFSYRAKMVRFDKAKTKDLADFMTEVTFDNSQYPSLDILRLDNYLKEVLADPKILADLAKIEVRNSTNKVGLATLATRVITNLGGNVVYTGNSEENLEKSQVIAYGKKDSTSQRLGEVLGAKVEVKKPDNQVRGDIVIHVGLDFFEKIHLK